MFVINMTEAVGTKMQSYCIAMSDCSMYFLLLVNTLLFKKKVCIFQVFFWCCVFVFSLFDFPRFLAILEPEERIRAP